MLKKITRRLLGCSARPVTSEIGHARTDPFFDCLVRIGFQPKHIVDVGANRGNWTRTALRYFPEAYYSLFEPQPKMEKEVADLIVNPKVKFYCMGAGPVSSTMKLSTHPRDDSFSFALDEAQASAQNREQIEARVVALDDFLPREGRPQADILKIDAEGWDLAVLKGAEKTAATAGVVLMEAAVMNKPFSNKINVVMEEMAKRGFVVFDITDLNRTVKQNALWLVELAFVKRGGFLDEAIQDY